MDLYLIRHAEAVPRGAEGYDDDWARPLTDAGRDQAERLGKRLARLGVRLDAIVTSPLVRARETTDGLRPLLPEPLPSVEVYDEIGEDMRPKRVMRYLEKLGLESVAIVGHQPMLGGFLAWLIGSRKARLDLDKAGMARVECDALRKGGGVLRWLVTPDWYEPADGEHIP